MYREPPGYRMSGPGGDVELLRIGRVARAHGIKGELAIDVLSDVAERFKPQSAVYLAGAWHTIHATRPHQGRLLVTLVDITDRTAAELLRGQDVMAVATEADPGEYYFVQDLMGCAVLDDAGVVLGTVVDIVGMPAVATYDLLEVARPDGSVWLLPAVDEFVVVEEDSDGRVIRLVNPPEGLINQDDR